MFCQMLHDWLFFLGHKVHSFLVGYDNLHRFKCVFYIYSNLILNCQKLKVENNQCCARKVKKHRLLIGKSVMWPVGSKRRPCISAQTCQVSLQGRWWASPWSKLYFSAVSIGTELFNIYYLHNDNYCYINFRCSVVVVSGGFIKSLAVAAGFFQAGSVSLSLRLWRSLLIRFIFTHNFLLYWWK